MLELVVLTLFVLIGFTTAVVRTMLRSFRDKRQQESALALAAEAHGSGIVKLITRLGDPYEIEHGTTGRELYIWKFPPANTLPHGTGLFTLTVTTDHGVVTEYACKRQL